MPKIYNTQPIPVNLSSFNHHHHQHSLLPRNLPYLNSSPPSPPRAGNHGDNPTVQNQAAPPHHPQCPSPPSFHASPTSSAAAQQTDRTSPPSPPPTPTPFPYGPWRISTTSLLSRESPRVPRRARPTGVAGARSGSGSGGFGQGHRVSFLASERISGPGGRAEGGGGVGEAEG